MWVVLAEKCQTEVFEEGSQQVIDQYGAKKDEEGLDDQPFFHGGKRRIAAPGPDHCGTAAEPDG